MPKFLIKRKHTELHPEKYATDNGYLRNYILRHIYNSPDNKMDYGDYEKLCINIQLTKELSYNPKSWCMRNPKYVKIVRNGNNRYLKLTRLGKNLVKIVLLNG